MMDSMLAGELFVRAELEREADQAEMEKDAGLTGAVRGAGRVVQETAGALGKGLEREIGGKAGKALRIGVTAVPTASAIGVGAYGTEKALGSPGQRWYEAQKAKLRRKLQSKRSVYDPGTGQWY
jgi:hypothetical protein